MPSRVTPVEDYRITTDLCKRWGTEHKILDVQPAVESLTSILMATTNTPLDRGNIIARCRMIVLFNLAKKYGRLVMGTSNESETAIGYFTKFGDGACDISPLSGIYKTQIRQIAQIIGIPENIIKRQPSAGLWEGQTDEGEIGMSYDVLDPVLYLMKQGRSDKEISDAVGVTVALAASVRDKVKGSEHKRQLPIRP
jgi:NAD+ synthase